MGFEVMFDGFVFVDELMILEFSKFRMMLQNCKFLKI